MKQFSDHFALWNLSALISEEKELFWQYKHLYMLLIILYINTVVTSNKDNTKTVNESEMGIVLIYMIGIAYKIDKKNKFTFDAVVS